MKHKSFQSCETCHDILSGFVSILSLVQTKYQFIRFQMELTSTYICRLFGTKCDKCLRSFGKNDFVMRAKNKIFHLECFRCVACEKQLVPGDEFALRDDGLFCREDHQESDHHRKDSIENNNTILHHNTSNSSEDNSEGNHDSAFRIPLSLPSTTHQCSVMTANSD